MLKLDVQLIEESIGVLRKNTNQDILDTVSNVVNTVRSNGDENEITAQVMELGEKFQSQYNAFMESTDGFIAEAGQYIDLAEYMKSKANIGDISSRDTSFKQDSIDTASVMI